MSNGQANLTNLRTSPTAYNVFTAYAINRQTLVEGNCMTLTGATTTLVTPYLETITSPEGIVTLDAAGEQKFVTDVLQITTCSGQDVNIVPSAFVPVTSITATVTQNHQTVSRAFASLTIAPVRFFISEFLNPRPHQCAFLLVVL